MTNSSTRITVVTFVLGCTWLALHVWINEYGPLLLTGAVALVQPRPERWRRSPERLELPATS